MTATLSNGQPAYTRAKPRIRQSEIDAAGKWSQSEIRALRTAPMEQPGFLARLFGRTASPEASSTSARSGGRGAGRG